MKNSIITGLDIGSTAVRIVIGQNNSDSGLRIIGGIEGPSAGISKGVVTSIEDVVSSISYSLEKVEQMSGLPCEHAFVGISNSHIISQESHGVVAVAKADGEIKENDIKRVLDAAQTVATPPNYEILHIIPRVFTVDNQTGIKDPVGMTGVRLEVDAQIIQGLSSQIKNLNKCVNRTGVEIDELVFSILATSEAVLDRRQKELGVAVVDIGGSITNLAVFEEGDILTTKVLPIGSGHITSDIAIGLRTSIDVAEKIKLNYGSAIPLEVDRREEINLKEFDNNEDERISTRYVAEIIEARCEEIFKLVDKGLEEVNRSKKLPAGIILTGGGAQLDGLVNLAKDKFKLPVFIGYPKQINIEESINNPAFSTAIGLVLWGKKFGGSDCPNLLSRFSGDGKFLSKIKNWFKSLIP